MNNMLAPSSEYRIEPFGALELDEHPTIRPGFFVRHSLDSGTTSCFARALQGYTLNPAEEGTPGEQVEEDILHLAFVYVNPKISGRGLATGLITRALAEARERELHFARLAIENPKVIHILHKIGERGLVQNARFALSSSDPNRIRIPTHDFSTQPNPMDERTAMEYLNGQKLDREGMLDDPTASGEIDCVVQITH